MKSALVLRNKSEKTGKSSVYVEYSYKGKIKRIPTSVKVAEKHWNAEKGLVKKSGSDNHDTENIHIHSIKKNVDSIILKHIEAKGVPPVVDYVASEYKKLNDNKLDKTLVDYIEDFIKLKTGKLSPNTIKGYSNLKDNISEYQKTKKKLLNFEDVNTIQFFEEYSSFLISKGYYNNTISKRLSVLKTVLTYYSNLGLSKSINYKLFRFENTRQKNKEVITLSVSELEAMKALDLSQNKRLDYIRDLFILQCWTGLRYVDVVRLNKGHIKKNAGSQTIKIDILKTNDFSDLPLFPEAKRILEKYDYEVKRISNHKYNKYIKEVCKLLPELDKDITFKHFSGTRPIVITKKKHEFISTHSARRTFITLMRGLGIPHDKIMKWSNHSDVRVFDIYNNTVQHEQEEVENVITRYQERVKAYERKKKEELEKGTV